MRSTAGGICHFASDHLVSGNLRLGKLAERDLLGATQVGEVRVILVPAAELARLLAHTRIALSPPRFGLAVTHVLRIVQPTAI